MSTAIAIYAREAKFEFIRLMRFPMFVTLTLLLPVMLYSFFGIMTGRAAGPAVSTVMLIAWSCYGVMGASLFGFGVALAVERGLGWLELKRASPMPPMAYFVAKLVTCLAFAFVIVLVLLTLGAVFADVRMPLAGVVRLVATLVAGALPFCALGLAIGYLASPNSAPAVANILYLPMTFLSGLVIPVESLPRMIRWLPPFLPPYHLSRLALAAVGIASDGQAWFHIGALAVFTAVCLAVARIGSQRGSG